MPGGSVHLVWMGLTIFPCSRRNMILFIIFIVCLNDLVTMLQNHWSRYMLAILGAINVQMEGGSAISHSVNHVSTCINQLWHCKKYYRWHAVYHKIWVKDANLQCTVQTWHEAFPNFVIYCSKINNVKCDGQKSKNNKCDGQSVQLLISDPLYVIILN